jgi:hypothetical protein
MRCRVSFRFRFAPADDPTNLVPAPPIAPPRGVRTDNDGHTLRITYRWYGRSAWFLFAGAIIMSLVAYFATADLLDEPNGVVNWLVIALAWAAAAAFAYLAACCLFTSSIVEVDPANLVVRTAPLPWFGAGRLPCNDLTEFECRFTFHHKYRKPVFATHQLSVTLRDGKKRTLIGVFPTPEHVWFFAEQLHAAISRHRR